MTHIFFRRTSTLRSGLFSWTVLLLYSLLCYQSTTAQTLPAGFKLSKSQGGYDRPTGLVFSADGKYQFVWDKSGKVWVSTWDGAQYVKQATPALNISEEVGNWRDFGLGGFCLDPNFSQNGRVYLYYMVDRHYLMKFGTAAYSATTDEYYSASISRVTRYQLAVTNGTMATVANSRQVLLGETKSTGVPLLHESHAGGALVFGRDGSLLVSTGDNATYNSADKGSSSDTYYQQAINDGIMRPNENVGSFRAQMLNSHCGKLLRIDPNTGDAVSSNPFYDAANPRSAKSRVWALGLRHPYRIALMPNTGSTNMADGNPGSVLVGDVGYNTWEEMGVITQAGTNAGWPIFEGVEINQEYASAANTLENKDEPNPTNTCNKPYLTFADLIRQPANPVQTVMNPCSGQPLPGLQRRYIHARPALDWKHGSNTSRTPTFTNGIATATNLGAAGGAAGTAFAGSCSIAGAMYPGAVFPAEWRNTYFFGDFSNQWIKAATLDANGNVTQIREFIPNSGNVVDIEYNPLNGALYYINIDTGEVLAITYGGNLPPVAALSANTLTGSSPLTVSFKGDGSTDLNGDALTYAWNFGDGTTSTSTQANPTKVFTSSGIQGFTVTLTVSDGKGLTDTKTAQVSLNNAAPTAKITNPVANALYPMDRESQYTLSARVTDEDASSLTYAWQVTLRHNVHEHREPVITTASPTITVSPVGCDGETYYYFIRLTVTDKGGLTATDSVKIYPDCNSAQLAITNLRATVQTNSVQLNWTAPTITYDNVLVVAKAGSGFTDRPSTLVYPADVNFTGSGADFFGGKVVYQGVASNLTVTNLTPGLTYYFRVYTRRGSAWTGGVETSVTPSIPVFAPKAGSCYRLVSRASGKVLSSEGSNNGSPVLQRTDTNLASQQWKFTPTTEGYYQIISQQSGKLLDVLGIMMTDRAPLGVWEYANGNNQQWKPQQNAEGYVQFVVRHSGKAIDLLDGSQSDGAVVGQVTPSATANQQWIVEERTCAVTTPPSTTTATTPVAFAPKTGSCYRLVSRASGKVLSSEGSNNGSPVLQRTDANLASQQWKFTPTTEGYYQIISQQSGKLLDVLGIVMTDRAPLGVWEYANGNNQQWKPQQNAEGYVQFVVRHSGKAIDLLDGSQSDGAVVGQVTPSATANQQWSVEERTCVVTTPPATTTVATFAPKTGSCYQIASRFNGKVLSSEGNNNGSAVLQRTDANLASQQWKFTATTEGYYQIISQQSGKVLDVLGILMTDRAPLGVWEYANGNNQQWKPQQNAEGYTQFIARHSGKAVDLLDGNQAEGAVVGQFTPNANAVQQWRVEERSCVVTTPPSTTTTAGFTPKTGSCYRIVSRFSGKVLGGETGSDGDIMIRQRTDANLAIQQWKFTPTSDGYYQIISQQNGKVIDVIGIAMNDQAQLHLWDYIAGGNQQWKLQQNAEGYTQFLARHSGKAIDLVAGTQADGAMVAQLTPNTNVYQQWTIEERTCSTPTSTTTGFSSTACYKIASRNGGRAISVPNGGTGDGLQLRQLTYTGKASQQWKIQINADGYYKLVNGNSGKVIDVYGGFTNDLASIIQWSSTGSPNQQWKITRDAQGYYVFTARHSGKAMDQKSSALNEDIIQWSASGGQNQQWTIDVVGCAAAGSRLGAFDLLAPLPEQIDNRYILYPNPAQSQVNVDLRAAQGQPASVTLTDLNGKLLYQRLVDTSEETYHAILTGNYPTGMYLLSINVTGSPKTTLRLLIER